MLGSSRNTSKTHQISSSYPVIYVTGEPSIHSNGMSKMTIFRYKFNYYVKEDGEIHQSIEKLDWEGFEFIERHDGM
jgi:hypothetical protein